MAPPARIPPTPGLIGFDFGVKPAVFLARTPFGSRLMNQQTDEDEFPIVNCWQYFGDTMDVVVSGIVFCGCFSDSSGGPTRYWSPVSMTGVNGAFTLNASNPGDPANVVWFLVIGSMDIQEYDGSPDRPAFDCDGTPIGDPVTVEVVLTVDCAFAQNKWLQAFIGATPPLEGTGGQIFSSTNTGISYFQAGETVPNVVSCQTDLIGYYANVAAEGQITVLVP